MNRIAAVLAIGLIPLSEAPPIRHVPRVVDVHFASRLRLCPQAPARGGMGQANDRRQSIGEFLGVDLLDIAVHQVGDSFPDFPSVQWHIRHVLAQRPREFSRYSPWAEPTPLAANGILGTLRYAHGRSGRLEIAGSHLCLQDLRGRVWWVRVGPIDVWP